MLKPNFVFKCNIPLTQNFGKFEWGGGTGVNKTLHVRVIQLWLGKKPKKRNLNIKIFPEKPRKDFFFKYISAKKMIIRSNGKKNYMGIYISTRWDSPVLI